MKDLLKNKFFMTAAGLTIGILILVLIISPKHVIKNTAAPSPTPPPSSKLSSELINLSDEKRNQVSIYVDTISSKLPIRLDNFPTSVGVNTSILISRLQDDPPELIHLEINGISYMNQEANPQKNPNITAFKESYLKAIDMLESHNVDPKQLIFTYSDRDYVNLTTNLWLSSMKLSP